MTAVRGSAQEQMAAIRALLVSLPIGWWEMHRRM
jgi:hypothetical protein